jgi:hypothetical protein
LILRCTISPSPASLELRCKSGKFIRLYDIAFSKAGIAFTSTHFEALPERRSCFQDSTNPFSGVNFRSVFIIYRTVHFAARFLHLGSQSQFSVSLALPEVKHDSRDICSKGPNCAKRYFCTSWPLTDLETARALFPRTCLAPCASWQLFQTCP